MDSSTLEIIKYVLLGLDILIIVISIITLLKGFLKGTIRTSIVFATQLIPLLIFFLFSGLIAKKIMNSSFNINGSSQTLIELVKNSLDSNMIDKIEQINAWPLIETALIAGIKLVLCIAFAIIVFVIISPLIRFILFLAIPKLRKKKPKIGSRLGGMGVALASIIIFFWLFALPIYGSLEVTQKVMNVIPLENEEKTIEDINNSFSTSFILKITSNIGKKKTGTFGMGAKRFGQLYELKINKTKINMVKEIDGIIPMVPRIMEIMNATSEEDGKNVINLITDADIDSLIGALGDSKILKVSWPYIVSYLKTIEDQNEMLSKMQLNFDALMQIDINKDIKASATFLKETLKLVKNIDFTSGNELSFLESDENINQIVTVLDAAYNIELFEEVFPKALYVVIYQQIGDGDFAFVLEWITPTYFRNDFSSDVNNIAQIYISLKNSQIIDYFLQKEGEYHFNDETKEYLDKAKEYLLNIKLLKDNYASLLESVDKFIPEDTP